jgi:hypothetical protein
VIYVGLDDTDTLESPGTVQLARHLVVQLASQWRGVLIIRHQLLIDPRVPCTRKNGCVAIGFEPLSKQSVDSFADDVCRTTVDWCPVGSDPGVCVVADQASPDIVEFGKACQSQLVSQTQARSLAARHAVTLRGLGGTEDGVIGALAAVGLASTADDGRVVYLGKAPVDHYDVSGVLGTDELRRLGVDDIRRVNDDRPVEFGRVEVGKRLRPNLRKGRIVLFVSPSSEPGVDWNAERVF